MKRCRRLYPIHDGFYDHANLSRIPIPTPTWNSSLSSNFFFFLFFCFRVSGSTQILTVAERVYADVVI